MQCDAINLVPSKKKKRENSKIPEMFSHDDGEGEGRRKKKHLQKMEHCRYILRNCLGKRNFSILFHYQKQEKKHHMTEFLVFFFLSEQFAYFFFLYVLLYLSFYVAKMSCKKMFV